ncbi:FFLEELY motif protein [Chloroflexus sp.]|uniref:FFLEELY motif protein n=1 Tax=Chloroflexus sp. TaxID=1904827 RepID=UPI0026272DBB|nr:hypothetical protein [uncultured Chloroflexus sp.]
MNTLRQYRIALQIFQSNRLRRDYQDLSEIPEYEPLGEFFFNEMYGPRDFSQRDQEGRRLQHFLGMLPGVHLRDLEEVLELLDLTYQLDDDLARLMQAAQVGTDFDETTYEHFYRLADRYDERLRQLTLIRSSLYNVFRLSRSSMLGMALRRSHFIARLAGIGHVHTFLRRGYEALQHLAAIDHFAETIYQRELDRLNRIYQR